MIWLAGSLAYTTLALGAARLMAGHLAWTMFENHGVRYPSLSEGMVRPNGDQWVGAWCAALAIAAVWPLAIAPWLVGRRVKVGAEREAALRDREQQIRAAEKELGLS